MRKLLGAALGIALMLSVIPTGIAQEIDWTRKGYYVVYNAQGEFISRHVSDIEAAMSAANHAFNSGNTGNILYRIESPYYEMQVLIPEVALEAPPEPPEAPFDTGEMLDPNTVFACDGGEQGVTSEPTGNDAASGWISDSEVQAVRSLRRLSEVWGAAPKGTDARLCEGGVFHDQVMYLSNSGDIGEGNEIVLKAYHQEAINHALRTRKNPELYAYMLDNVFPEEKERHIKSTRLGLERYGDENYWSKVHHALDGWDATQVNWATLGCYKILNGVPRPCMNPYPICREGTVTECLDPSDYTVRPFYSPS